MRDRLGANLLIENRAGTRLPSQRQPPGSDSKVCIVIPLCAKFDVLRCLVIRKDPLHSFVELLGKRCQVIGGIEFRTPQLLCLQVGDRPASGVLGRTLNGSSRPRCNKLPALEQT